MDVEDRIRMQVAVGSPLAMLGVVERHEASARDGDERILVAPLGMLLVAEPRILEMRQRVERTAGLLASFSMTEDFSSTLRKASGTCIPLPYFRNFFLPAMYFTSLSNDSKVMPIGASWKSSMSSVFGPHHLSSWPKRMARPYQNS